MKELMNETPTPRFYKSRESFEKDFETLWEELSGRPLSPKGYLMVAAAAAEFYGISLRAGYEEMWGEI